MVSKIKNWTIHNWVLFLAVILLTGWYTYSFFEGERVWVNQGLGWDGGIYSSITKHFDQKLAEQDINPHYLQHSLPSAVIFSVTKLINYELKTAQDFIWAHLLFRYFMLLLIAFYVHRISQHFKFTLQVETLLYTSIYITLPVLKKITYVPIGTDIAALTVGVIAFYYYLKSNYILLFLFSFLGAFAYPSMVYTGLIFLMVPNYKILKIEKYYKINGYANIVLSVLIAGLAYYIYSIGFKSSYGSQQLNRNLWYVSVICAVVYSYFMLNPIYYFQKIQNFNITKTIFHVIMGVVFFVSIKWFVHSFSNNEQGVMHISLLFKAILYGSIVNPFISIVSHISYYGPMLFIILLFWKQIYKEVECLGLPLVLFVILYLCMSLGRESRMFINAWPVFVIITCIVLNKYKISWSFVYVFIGMSILFSKVWFQINVPGIERVIGYKQLLEFPGQRFLMMNGSWMSTNVYFMHALAEVVLFGILFWFIRKEPVYNLRRRKNV